MDTDTGHDAVTRYLIAYLSTAVVFFAADLLWLGVVARRFYRAELGPLLLDKPNWTAAAGFYAMFVAGIVIFAVAPALRDGSVWTALLFGALFGFFTYGTYDMTNLATLKNWSTLVVVVDVVWGSVLTGGSAIAGYYVTRALSG